MTWYVASVIISIRLKSEKQERIPVYENFYLVDGISSNEALQKAIAIGGELEKSNNDMTLGDEPAHMVFEGIRKLVNISNPYPLDLDKNAPVNGTELTYSEYMLDNNEQINRLVKGEDLIIKYVRNL